MKCFLMLFFMMATSAHAGVTQITLPAAPVKAPAGLVAVKTAENQEKWAICNEQAAKNFAKYNDIKGWILTTWLRCARKTEAKGEATAASRAALAAFDKNPALLNGPWEKSLRQEQVATRLQVIEREMKKKSASLSKELDALLGTLEPSDKENRAKAFAFYGDWAQAQRDIDAAKLFYEQSLNEKENRQAREKYAQVLFALNQKNEKTSEAAKEEFMSEGERRFEERFANSQKNGDLAVLVEDCVAYLNRYPQGKRAKWATERVLDIYLTFLDEAQTGTERGIALRDRALAIMEKADASRIGEWARVLHRRADHAGSLRLAEKSLSLSGNNSANGILLYVAGRSAQFMGNDAKAQILFETYADSYSAGDDIAEVLFRLGLTHLRLNQPPSAVAVFERLLLLKNKDRYELGARYWMVRALEASKSPRAALESDSIIQKYPFSYYGLKLRAEANKGILEWPYPLQSATALKGKMALTGPQKKSWDRIRLLSAAGWRWEALVETFGFPNPEDGRLKALLAKTWNEGQAYPLVIKLMNEASDESIDLRTRDLMALGLPKDFQTVVEGEAKKFGLQPVLVWSLIRQESAFNPRAVSSSNALGLMQLIPPTAKEVAQDLKMGELDLPDDVFNPERNIPMGTSYLARMIRQFQNSVPLGLAAYNAGPKRMDMFVKARPQLAEQITKAPQSAFDELWMDELPWFETSFYVKAILRNTLMYRLLDQRRVNLEMTVWKDLIQSPTDTASGPVSASAAH